MGCFGDKNMWNYIDSRNGCFTLLRTTDLHTENR